MGIVRTGWKKTTPSDKTKRKPLIKQNSKARKCNRQDGVEMSEEMRWAFLHKSFTKRSIDGYRSDSLMGRAEKTISTPQGRSGLFKRKTSRNKRFNRLRV